MCVCLCVCVCENSIIIIIIVLGGNIVVHIFLLLSAYPTASASHSLARSLSHSLLLSFTRALSHHLCILFTGCSSRFIFFIAAEKPNAKSELQMAGKFLIDHQINVSPCNGARTQRNEYLSDTCQVQGCVGRSRSVCLSVCVYNRCQNMHVCVSVCVCEW